MRQSHLTLAGHPDTLFNSLYVS